MKLYPAWRSESAIQFYAVADNSEELQRLNEGWRKNKAALFNSIGETLDMAHAFRLILGIEGTLDDRFCRVAYESDGMWRATILGPAYDAIKVAMWGPDAHAWSQPSEGMFLGWLEARLMERLGLEAKA